MVSVLKTIPSLIKISTLLSIISFSNLKFGMPYLNSPPILSSLSKTVTLCPALLSCCAAARPAGPDPITATVLPVLVLGIWGLIQPSLKAFSTIYFSIFSIEIGSSIIPNTQAFSHGAGQSLPVNSGKLLVECNIQEAFFHSP